MKFSTKMRQFTGLMEEFSLVHVISVFQILNFHKQQQFHCVILQRICTFLKLISKVIERENTNSHLGFFSNYPNM